MKKKSRLCLGLILLILCCLICHAENTSLQISSYSIINRKIPDDFNGFKIIQISDFHNTKSQTLRNDLIREIKGQDPDLLVLTGDLIDANRTDIEGTIEFIEEIKEVAPIYFVSGNHEAGIKNYAQLEKELTEKNVILLKNDLAVLKRNESEINLLGIEDPRMAHESFVSDSEIIKTELNGIQYDPAKFSILLSHRPELFELYTEYDLDLVLSGHAHGGQIRLPFLGGIFAPNQGLFPQYTEGMIEKKQTTLVVSRGIGNSLFPFRINNRPELVVILLSNQ